MKRKLLLMMLIIFVSIFTARTQTCVHSVELSDSYGDGWNGGTLTITVNGSAVLTGITGTGYGPNIFYFDAATGDDIDADYTVGDWSTENEYIVKDGGGGILGQSGQDDETPVDILDMIGNCPACPPPTGQTETNITTTTADLGWTTGGASTWDIEWGPEGFTIGTGTRITGTATNPYHLTGLATGNLYDWYVRDDCGGDVSDWTGPHTFATACDAIISFPYTESFEDTWTGTPPAPLCWSQITVSGTNVWNQSTYLPHTGTFSAIAPWATTGGEHLLITPGFDFGTANYRLRFWLKGNSNGGTDLKVQIADDNSAAGNFTTELAYYVAGTNMPTVWTEYIIDLSAYEDVQFIAFRMIDLDGYSLYIDDVTVEEIQALPPDPATDPFPFDGLTTLNNPLLSWTAALTGEPATGYRVYLDETNPPTTEVYDGTDLEFQTTGLSAGTTYYWQVVPYNATGDATGTSVWSFTTVADGFLAESFENVTFPPSGWANPGSWSRSTSQNLVGLASAYKYTSTTHNLLRTPMVTITGSSTLDFFVATTAANTDQRVQVQYSADGTTWNDIGAEISLPSMQWAYYSIDLSSLAGNNYYLAFATYTAGSAGGVYLDHVIGPMITPLLPDAVTLTAPADGAIDQTATPTLTWTSANTGGVPTGYKVYLDENTDPTTLYQDVASSPYTVSPALNYNTTYYWKVVAYNDTGDGAASNIRSFTTKADPTLTPPFTQTFDTYPPTNWGEAAGLLAAPTVFSSTSSSTWAADGFANVGTTGSARVNIYGTSADEWMKTPPINLGNGSTAYRLTFDLALTAYASTGAAATTGVDDKFAVVISTDNGATWTSANTLMLWDNAGSTNVYNDIATAGENIIINLSSYSGIVQLGFYGESTVSNADNDLFVDNVTVEEIPLGPLFAVSPELMEYGTINIGASSSVETFTISNTGMGTLQITSVLLGGTDASQFDLTDANTYPVDLTTGQSITVDVAFAPTSVGEKTASLDISDDQGGDIHMVALTGTGFDPYITAFPYSQLFDAVSTPNLPMDWSSLNSTGNTFANVTTSSTAAYSTPNSARLYNSGATTGELLLISPPTALNTDGTRVNFWAKTSSGDQNLIVGIMTDPSNAGTFTEIETLLISSTFSSYSVIVTGGVSGDNYIAFKHGLDGTYDYFYIDNFIWEEIPTTPVFAVTPESKDFGTINTGETSAVETFTISNAGLGTLEITGVVLGGTNADQFDLTDANNYPVDLTMGQSITVDVAFMPTSAGEKIASLEITDDQGGDVHMVVLTGTGFVPPQGSICSNPLPLDIPAVDVAGNTVDFGDDYSSTDISPSSSYLNGDDVVYQFTVDAGTLTGTIITTGTWMGAFILSDCPNASNPPTPVYVHTSGSSNSVTFFDDLPAGTYYLIISSFPAPQSIDYNINLSLTEYPANATWTGSTSEDWADASNWSGTEVPGFTTDVTIPASGITNYPTLTAAAKCNNLTIESTASGDGSLIGQSNLTVNGTTTIQRYTTAGKWHGISAPLSGDDFNSLYLGGNPDVWGMSYDEATNEYTYASDLETELGDAKGWMVWIGGSTAQTFDFSGDLRTGNVGPIALTNTVPDALHGFNFVGNPYPSAIDWDADPGWTKTNVDAGIWVWNPDAPGGANWATYISPTGTNGGSNHIAIGQGFFVQVNSASATGSLQMTTAIQSHSGENFMKEVTTNPSDFIRLKLSDGDRYDESIIRLDGAATEGYDSQFDMHKMFSWSEEQPQLYSTANNFMAINVLPQGTVSVPMDVRGVDGNEMTIAIEEVTDFDQVYLSDDYTGVQTNLMEGPYTFVYDAGLTDRFTVYFTIVGTTENQLENAQVYSFDKKIRVIIPMEMNAHVEVTNMLGQTVDEMDAHLGTHDINIAHGGYYLVTITGDNQRITRKVFIK